MGTIFPSENSGVFTLMAGMIGLVMFGVLITMFMDGSVSFGGNGDIAGALETQRVELEDLRERKKARQAKIDEIARLHAVSRQAGVARKELAEAQDVLESLRSEVTAGESEVSKLAGEFDEYRDRHRAGVWLAATGVALGDLTTSQGKLYRNAIVKILTATELRITHEGGPATIQVTELPPDVRERFHLDLGEAVRLVQERKEKALARLRALAEKREKQRLAEEERRRQEEDALARRPRRGRGPALTKEEDAKLRELRSEVNRMYVSMRALRQDLASARSQRGGPDRSPPGSLQTWAQRVAQLTRREAKAWEVVRAKEAEVRRLDPTYVRPAGATSRDE